MSNPNGEAEQSLSASVPAATLKKWGLHTPQSLRERTQQLNGSCYLVDRLIPFRSVGFLLGDSGLGKSPLWYQLAICVASGTPFLGRAVSKGGAVIVDFENGLVDVQELVERISRYLGVSEPPSDLLIWSVNDCPANFGPLNHTVLDMLRDVHPALAIIDSLGSYKPEAEEKNSTTIRMLKEFRELAREHGTATQVIHHRRKESRKKEESAGSLETANLRRWFQDTRGASGLVNASDVRLGVDEPDLITVKKDDVALVLRGFGRVRGEVGPLYLRRDFDDDQRPLGYRCLIGPELICNKAQEDAYRSLPPRFRFGEAKNAYGKADQSTRNWLVHMEDLRLVRRVERGVYEKQSSDVPGAAGNGVRGGTE
jgi:hypothetical protein